MAREILFKAKRTDNGEWVEGYLVKCRTSDEEGYAIKDTVYHVNDGIINIIPCMVHEETICQYTGLTDKNGNKIWENDVVRCVDYNSNSEFMAVVEFGNPNSYYSWGYQLRHINGDEPNLDILLWIDMEEAGATCEVIGNIFDNPELLGGADNG